MADEKERKEVEKASEMFRQQRIENIAEDLSGGLHSLLDRQEYREIAPELRKTLVKDLSGSIARMLVDELIRTQNPVLCLTNPYTCRLGFDCFEPYVLGDHDPGLECGLPGKTVTCTYYFSCGVQKFTCTNSFKGDDCKSQFNCPRAFDCLKEYKPKKPKS